MIRSIIRAESYAERLWNSDGNSTSREGKEISPLLTEFLHLLPANHYLGKYAGKSKTVIALDLDGTVINRG